MRRQCTDFAFRTQFGSSAAVTALLVHSCSWIFIYCGSRTLINVTESSFLLIVFCLLVSARRPSLSLFRGWRTVTNAAVAVSALCAWIRPTAVIPLVGVYLNIYAVPRFRYCFVWYQTILWLQFCSKLSATQILLVATQVPAAAE
jgi:hypothetical protein